MDKSRANKNCRNRARESFSGTVEQVHWSSRWRSTVRKRPFVHPCPALAQIPQVAWDPPLPREQWQWWLCSWRAGSAEQFWGSSSTEAVDSPAFSSGSFLPLSPGGKEQLSSSCLLTQLCHSGVSCSTDLVCDTRLDYQHHASQGLQRHLSTMAAENDIQLNWTHTHSLTQKVIWQAEYEICWEMGLEILVLNSQFS